MENRFSRLSLCRQSNPPLRFRVERGGQRRADFLFLTFMRTTFRRGREEGGPRRKSVIEKEIASVHRTNRVRVTSVNQTFINLFLTRVKHRIARVESPLNREMGPSKLYSFVKSSWPASMSSIPSKFFPLRSRIFRMWGDTKRAVRSFLGRDFNL